MTVKELMEILNTIEDKNTQVEIEMGGYNGVIEGFEITKSTINGKDTLILY